MPGVNLTMESAYWLAHDDDGDMVGMVRYVDAVLDDADPKYQGELAGGGFIGRSRAAQFDTLEEAKAWLDAEVEATRS